MRRTRISLLSLIATALVAIHDALRPTGPGIDGPDAVKAEPAGSRSG